MTDSSAFEEVRIRVLPDGRMDRENAALYLGKKPKTLAMWAMQGVGPPFVKIGHRCFYFRLALDEFIQRRPACAAADDGDERRGRNSAKAAIAYRDTAVEAWLLAREPAATPAPPPPRARGRPEKER
jgi:hypothetical protein